MASTMPARMQKKPNAGTPAISGSSPVVHRMHDPKNSMPASRANVKWSIELPRSSRVTLSALKLMAALT